MGGGVWIVPTNYRLGLNFLGQSKGWGYPISLWHGKWLNPQTQFDYLLIPFSPSLSFPIQHPQTKPTHKHTASISATPPLPSLSHLYPPCTASIWLVLNGFRCYKSNVEYIALLYVYVLGFDKTTLILFFSFLVYVEFILVFGQFIGQHVSFSQIQFLWNWVLQFICIMLEWFFYYLLV